MSNDKTREAFEAWAKERGYQRDELDRCRTGIVGPAYYNLNTEMAWSAWQAALSASEGAAPVAAEEFRYSKDTSGGQIKRLRDMADGARLYRVPDADQFARTLDDIANRLVANYSAGVPEGYKLVAIDAPPQPAVNGAGLSDDMRRASLIANEAQRFADDRTHLGAMVYLNDLAWALRILAAPDAQARPWPMEVQPDGTTVAVDPADLPAQARPVADDALPDPDRIKWRGAWYRRESAPTAPPAEVTGADYLIRARFPDGIEVYLDVNGVHDLGDKTGIDVSMPDYCKSPVHEHTAAAPQPAVTGAGLSDVLRAILLNIGNTDAVIHIARKALAAAPDARARPVATEVDERHSAPKGMSDERRALLGLAQSLAAPTAPPAEVTANCSEDVQRFAIDVEKMLCAKLGHEWRPSGMSIESLINDLAAAAPDAQARPVAAHADDGTRYRFIRENSCPVSGVLEVLTIDTPPVHLCGERMDGAIDALMAGTIAAPGASAPDSRWQLHHQHLRGDLEPDATTAPPAEAMPAPAAEADVSISTADVVAAVRAVGKEGRRRGSMFPQTADEQDNDDAAVCRVIESLEFYGPKPGSESKLAGWPLYTRPAAPPSEVTDAQRLDWLETRRKSGASKGFKSDSWGYDTEKSVRSQIDAAIAATSAGEEKS